jgi:intracellular septation protein
VDEGPVLLATIVVIAATLVHVATLKLMRKRIDFMLWVTLALVVVLGGATIWFHDKTFIKWKPSIAFWTMGLGLWITNTFFGKNLVKTMIGGELKLPDTVWQRLNHAWVAFFCSLGLVNVYVLYNFSDSAWATFKVFGVTGFIIVFMVVQVLYLSRYVKDEPDAPADAAGDPKA